MNRSGKISFGCIIMSVILAIAGVAAYQLIPLRIKAAEFKEAVKRAAENCATENKFTTQMAVGAILEKAKVLKLPVTEKQVRVERTGQVVRAEANYEVTVDIIGYKYTQKFNAFYEAPRFD